MHREQKESRISELLWLLEDEQLDRIAADVLFMLGENARRDDRAPMAGAGPLPRRRTS